MSDLAEILQPLEQIDLKQINTKLPEITLAADNCKTEVTKYLENVYVKFSERPKRSKKLATNSKQLIGELAALKENIEKETKSDLSKANNELANNIASLEKTNVTLTIIQDLCEIHEVLIDIRALQESKSYIRCMEQIKSLEEIIAEKYDDSSLVVINEIKAILSTEKSALINQMTNVFKDNVLLELSEMSSKIKIKEANDEMRELLAALFLYKTSVTPLDNVTKFLWNNCFVPVVDFITEIEISKEHNFNVLEITTRDSTKNASYLEVFAALKTVLNFLFTNFNFRLKDDFTCLAYIGEDLSDILSELIIKHCLEHTIPSTEEGLKEYDAVIKATEDLENALINCQIFAEDTISILDYANDIDVLFINKKCQNYLLTAEKIMKKDLHQMTEVGEINDNPVAVDEPKNFPKCSISKNVNEIFYLAEKILQQATSASDVCAGRLVCTVQNIFRMYTVFVPDYHQKLLQTIPQQVALFHNNCLYIAYKLTELNESYASQMSSIINLGPVMFKEETLGLQKIAREKFMCYVQGQIKQIDEIMKESGLSNHRTLEKLEASTEKCVRQCLRQQELLKTVWHKVLSYTVYNKSLGAILNSLCNYLVDAVVKFEDISSDAAEQLVETFKIVQTRGPKLFTDSKEIGLFVKSWCKFNELIFVLGASLLDINDRWADGKGLLALQFQPEDVKQLIRALFQNTERRAALLAKIHE